jgi:hypothetical protein
VLPSCKRFAIDHQGQLLLPVRLGMSWNPYGGLMYCAIRPLKTYENSMGRTIPNRTTTTATTKVKQCIAGRDV